MAEMIPPEPKPIVVNGRAYPLWSQFVHGKDRWIGGELIVLTDRVIGGEARTIITDIRLGPNGGDSAALEIVGEEFSCAGDVRSLGIMPREGPGIHFHVHPGNEFTIVPKSER